MADAVGHLRVDLGRQAAVRLAGLLVDDDVVGQRTRAGAQLELLGGEGEVHVVLPWCVRIVR